MIAQSELVVATKGRDSYDLTAQIQELVANAPIQSGLVHVFLKHTSASLMICENADPAVRADLEAFMKKLVTDGDPLFTHDAEGPDDMPAHVRSVLTHTDLTIPIVDRQCALGTWQGIYLWEHRFAPHSRTIIVTISGD